MFLLLALSSCLVAAPPIRVLAWDDSILERKLALVAAESSIEITGLHPLKRSPFFRLKGAGPFAIRALDKGTTPDGKPIDRPCPIPESLLVPLVVLMPDESHPTGIRPLVIDDSPAGFEWGSYRFLNATPKEIVVQMEKKAIRVPTGWKPVDLNLGGETRGIGARVALAEAIEKPLYTAVWEYDTNVRILCFVVPGTDPRLGPIAFKAIPEDRRIHELETKPAPKAESPAPKTTPKPNS